MPGVLHLSYRGGRNYITIHQIIQGYFNLSADYWNTDNLQKFSIRIKKPIKKHCRLIDPIIHKDLGWNAKDIVVEFRITESGRSFKQYLVSDGDLITEHVPDNVPDWDDVLSFNSNTVRLNKPVGLYHSEVLMGMGKAIIVKQANCKQPRVVEYFVTEMLRSEDEMKFKMSLEPIQKKQFRKLHMYVDERVVGYILFWIGLG
jgi:hypothetical protein